MRILMLNHNVVWRSTFYRCFNFAKQLVRRGHELTVVTISPIRRMGFKEYFQDGVKIVESPDTLWGIMRTGWDPWDTLMRLLRLRHEPYDLVHGFDCRPVVIFPSLFTKNKWGIPFVSDWADWWGKGGVIEERPNKLIKIFFGAVETYFEEGFRHKADALTVISTALRERARGLGIPAERILHLPGGSDVETWIPLPKDKVRAEVGLSPDDKVAAFSGFVHYDLELVLRSFGKVCQTFPKARLILTGQSSPLTGKIGREMDIVDNIMDLGIVPYQEVGKYVSCADVCLLPFANKIANIGRWPNKVGDYMALGQPIVSNPVGDIKTLFESERIGLLAQDNAEDFAAKIVQLLDDPHLAAEMGENARRVALEKYSYEQLARRLENYYHTILDSKGSTIGDVGMLSNRGGQGSGSVP
ncbi:MAG: glycosyltransferase family 4 protein [Chloroflexi bacterium]|nr:glycosyltransferase family 4 protein [Chloroflexota bacterium]MCL5075292.1 glycosyltransferase family 4 protein [Chloroflexota bacterium]